jgi:hypothetical protein
VELINASAEWPSGGASRPGKIHNVSADVTSRCRIGVLNAILISESSRVMEIMAPRPAAGFYAHALDRRNRVGRATHVDNNFLREVNFEAISMNGLDSARAANRFHFSGYTVDAHGVKHLRIIGHRNSRRKKMLRKNQEIDDCARIGTVQRE